MYICLFGCRYRLGYAAYSSDLPWLQLAPYAHTRMHTTYLLLLLGLFSILGILSFLGLLSLLGRLNAIDTEQFGLEDEGSAARDGANAAGAVAVLRGDSKGSCDSVLAFPSPLSEHSCAEHDRNIPLLADAHVEQALVPAVVSLLAHPSPTRDSSYAEEKRTP